MELRTESDYAVRQPPVPNGPTVKVIFGGAGDSPDVGLVRVEVPPGASMPPHQHNGSDVILTPITGHVRIAKDAEAIEVRVGDSALVEKDEAVSLTNPGNVTAQVIVAAGPANFVSHIREWPAP